MPLLVLLANAVAIGSAAATPDNTGVGDFMSFTSRGQLAVYDGHVAWVETLRGVANVFGAIETQKGLSDPFALTNWTADDGMEISLFGFYGPASGDRNPLVHYDRRPSGAWTIVMILWLFNGWIMRRRRLQPNACMHPNPRRAILGALCISGCCNQQQQQ